MSNFFKSSAFVKSFFVFGAAFFATLSISCKQLASFDPVVNGEQTVVSGGTTSETAEFAFNLKATHGLVRKISLEWTAFSGAKYYEIYFAESSSAEFAKIGETEQPFFDDAVGAGRTGYFKVCAVKANGASSPFSSTVVGTSLAVPIISDGEVGESEANISWSMENARGIDGTDYYEKTLKFEVVCQPKGGSDGETKVLSASSFSGSSYSCKFENLSSSQDYEFYIEAYLEGDTQSREKSPTVDKTTLTAYTPLAPKFTASEGDNAKGISLLITLPEMVSVNTVTEISPDEKVDKLYPLCFEIYRKHAETYPADPVGGTVNGDKCRWYYDGTKLTKTPVEYKEDGKPYEAGRQVIWFDDDASLIGGVKYDYMIRSFVDINYSKVVCPKGKEYEAETGTPKNKATTAQGWKSAHPSFKVKSGKDVVKTFKEDEAGNNVEVLSYEFGFSAEWNDLGKAGDYKFAIKQNRKPWDAENSVGEDTWLEGGKLFNSLDEINSHLVKFGSESGLTPNDEGLYTYTLYIVSKDVGKIDGVKDEDEDKVLCHTEAIDKVLVTKSVDLPKADFTVKGGYKDRVILIVSNPEPNVTYKVTRTTILKDGIPPSDSEEKTTVIPLCETGDVVTDTTFEESDTEVQDNCRYSYVLKATDKNGGYSLSESQVAETLGTPKVSFKKDEESFGYDSVTISFDGVLAAKGYSVTLGTEGGFGGGIPYTFAAGSDSTSGNMKVLLAGNTYTVTINYPEGYNDAKKAGVSVDAVVMADSGEDKASGSVPVNVLGPALLDAKVNTFDEAEEDFITVSWNKVEDAKGYLIRRVMYSDAGMTKVEDGSSVTYYYDASDKETLAEGGKVDDTRAKIVYDEAKREFTLTDKYKEHKPSGKDADEPDRVRYEKAQAKIFWGLPFRYVVLPVLKSDDFDFNGLDIENGSAVTYKDLKPTDGVATLGYGMEVHAEKSKNIRTQAITWVKPFYASQTAPRVFRRQMVAGKAEGSFSLVDTSANLTTGVNKFEYELENDDKYNAYEYIVQYGVVSTPTLNDDFLKDFEERKDVESPTEQANKGYLFTVEDFNLATCNLAAAQGGSNTYAESVKWNKDMKVWDYKDRALGPTGVKLYSMNYNIDGEWHPIAKIGSLDYSGNVEALGEDVSAAKGSDGISLYPKGIAEGSSGTTSGALKVLRDYKHYYALSLTRGNLETQMYKPGFDDFAKDSSEKEIAKVFAYREVTPKELLILSMDTIRSSFKKKWYTEGDWKGDLKSTSFDGTIDGTCYTGIDRNGFSGTNYRRYQRFVNYIDSFVKINGTMMKDNGGGVGTNQYQGKWLHNGSAWPTDGNFNPQTDCLTVSLYYFDKEHNGQIKLNNIEIGNNDANAPNWKSGTFEVTYNGKTESFDNKQIPFGFLMNDETFYNKVEEMCY